MNKSTTLVLALAGALASLVASAESIQWSGRAGAAWSGSANWSGGKVPSPTDTVVLGDGAHPTVGTDTLRQRGGRIDDWSVPDAWNLDGDTIQTGMGYTENSAYVTNNNVLVITDDAGGQRNFAFYKRHYIGLDEIFEVEFDYQATLLKRYANESRAEGFGCYFGEHAAHFDWAHSCAIPLGVYGFMVRLWGIGGFTWIYGQDRSESVDISAKDMGLDFYKPVHMKVRFDHGLLTVRMTQGATVWSATRDVSVGFANGTRRAFGFSGGTTANALYYAYQTVSNFVGRSSYMGGVCREGYLPYSENTWTLFNRSSPAPMLIENAASLMMTNYTAGLGTAVCKKKIPTKEAFTFEFTERLSSVGSWGEGMSVAVNPTTETPELSGNRFTVQTPKAIGFGHKWWENLFRFYNNEAGLVADSANSPNGITMAQNVDYRFFFSHDGCGKFTARVMRGTAAYVTEQNCPEVLNWGDDMYLGYSFGAIWNDSLICRATDPRLGFTYDGPTEIADEIAVTADAAATLSVANLTKDSSGAAITVPKLTLSAGSRLTVAPSTTKGVRVTADTIRATGPSAVAVASGAVFELNRIQIEGRLEVTGKWSAPGGVITLVASREVFRSALANRLMELDPANCIDATLPTFALLDENGVPYSPRRRVVYENGIVSLVRPGSAITIR